ncbi:MAG: hypothetical protein LBO72_04045 [Helicobacteraceae bacterium]|nr:hypothetical protein [Helicobacteraceae bacterium]
MNESVNGLLVAKQKVNRVKITGVNSAFTLSETFNNPTSVRFTRSVLKIKRAIAVLKRVLSNFSKGA